MVSLFLFFLGDLFLFVCFGRLFVCFCRVSPILNNLHAYLPINTNLDDVVQEWDCMHGSRLLIWFGPMILLSTAYKIIKSQNLPIFKRRHFI